MPESPTPTTVMVLASLHGYHHDHPTYDYETLFETVERFDPDYVGVEIRPEDLRTEESYLKRTYPREMIELAKRYEDGRCFGFDWLGADIAGRPGPETYGRSMRKIQCLEQALVADPDMRCDEADALVERQLAIIENATPASLNDGRYGAVTRRYYQVLDAQLRGTRYAPIARFRRRRNRAICRQIVEFIGMHHGARIALVMGANHRVFVMKALRSCPELAPIRFVQPEA